MCQNSVRSIFCKDTSTNTIIFKISEMNSDYDIQTPNILIDSGASANIVCDEQFFEYLDPNFTNKNSYLELADGSKVNNLILGKGTASIPITDNKGKLRKITLNDCLFIPSFGKNIMSLSSAVRDGASFDLNKRGNETMRSNDGHIFNIDTKDNLYILNNLHVYSIVSRSAEDWHKIFGHTHHENICKLPNAINNMSITNKSKLQFCEPCIFAKMERDFSRVPCPRVDTPFTSIFCDLNGPLKEDCEYNYVFGAIDDFSGYLAIYLMQSKSESPNALKQFLADHANFGKTTKIRSDSGGEFNSNTFKKILIDNTIRFETCSPHSSFQNGRIERSWKTLFNMSRAILFDSKVNVKLYPYILKHACFLMNRTYSEYLQMTPIEAALNIRPDANDIHLFGSLCYGYQHHIHKTKFQPRAAKALYIGKDPMSPAHLLYYPDTDTIRRTRCVKFTNSYYYNTTQSECQNHNHGSANARAILLPNGDLVDPCQQQSADHLVEDTLGVSPGHLNAQPQTTESSEHLNRNRYPHRQRHMPDRLGVDTNYDCDFEDSICNIYVINNINFSDKSNINVPNTFLEAIYSNEREFWIKAMNKEIKSLVDNNTYDLVYLPPGHKVIGGRWVYALKLTPPNIYTFKARYVAKGFSQRPGVNYDMTFAPTARIATIRILLNIAIQFGLILHQLDVDNAFLNSNIDYEIYMRQPEGFIHDPNKVCKLNKSIYGLKQSAMLWNQTLLDFMKQQNLKQSSKDPCLFIRNESSNMLYVLIWVDDIICASSSKQILSQFKDNFSKSFKIKDIGPLAWFLGIAFHQTNDYISMNQKLYINNILNRFGMANCKPRSLPCDPNVHKLLEKYSPVYEDPTHYRELVGSLIYLYCCTRPDLSFIVSLLSRFMASPKVIHLQIANGVLHYLKYTVEYDLKYVKSDEPLHLFGYTDSDFAQNPDCHSISGYCFKINLNSALVSWKSAKQTIVAWSTTEAEYIAAGEAVKEALFLRELFSEIMNKQPATVTLFCDNHAALCLMTNSQQHHKRTKHINIAFHAIRTYVANKSVHISYVASKDNLADIFTKALNGFKMKRFSIIRGVVEKLK